jgi:hypothetical protein
MSDALPDNKALIIFYRAVNHYKHSSVSSTIRFLYPRIPDGYDDPQEIAEAKHWWHKLPEKEKAKLQLEYQFAKK